MQAALALLWIELKKEYCLKMQSNCSSDHAASFDFSNELNGIKITHKNPLTKNFQSYFKLNKFFCRHRV